MIKEFWRGNKLGYLVSCLVFSVFGLIVYAMTEPTPKMQNYFMMLPLFWVGLFLAALGLHTFIGGRK